MTYMQGVAALASSRQIWVLQRHSEAIQGERGLVA